MCNTDIRVYVPQLTKNYYLQKIDETNNIISYHTHIIYKMSTYL